MVKSSIAGKAAEVASSILSKDGAPTATSCCQIGTEAFTESQTLLQAEYTLAFAAIAEAQTMQNAAAEANITGWNITEQNLQVLGASQGIMKQVLAQAEATESAWLTSETALAIAQSEAAAAFASAESFLHVEAAWFTAEACPVTEPVAPKKNPKP